MRTIFLLLTFLLSSLTSFAQSLFVTTANLNMRALPCTCAPVSRTIPKGAVIHVLNYEDEGWARVTYKGHTNYVSRKYITQKRSVTSHRKATRYLASTLKSTRVRYYTNSYGERVQSPTYYQTAPAGATAICRDGTYSFSRSRRGTCSHHGGVARWL